MKSNELMIGNYVNDPYDKVIKLISVEEDASFLTPIEISEDWLLKLGFNYDSDLKNLLIKSGISCNIKNMEFCYMGHKIKKQKYVHQVQNLYFSLVGN